MSALAPSVQRSIKELAERLGCEMTGPSRFYLFKEAGLEVCFFPSDEPSLIGCAAGFTWDTEDMFEAASVNPTTALDQLLISMWGAGDFWERIVDRINRDCLFA